MPRLNDDTQDELNEHACAGNPPMRVVVSHRALYIVWVSLFDKCKQKRRNAQCCQSAFCNTSNLVPCCLVFLMVLCGAFRIPPTSGAESGNVLARLKAARAGFRPVELADVLRQVDAVRACVPAVEEIIGGDSERGRQWKKYLKWKAQLEQLGRNDAGDPEFWNQIVQLESIVSDGLDDASFRAHRRQIRKLIAVITAARNDRLSDEFLHVLDRLESIFQADENGMLGPEELEQVNRLLRILADQQQARELIDGIRREYSDPNVLISIPSQVLQQSKLAKSDEPYSVDECIRGARVRGSGNLSAVYALATFPADERTAVQVKVSGRSVSDTIGLDNGVGVRSHGELFFESRAQLEIGINGMVLFPGATTGTLQTTIRGVSTRGSPFRVWAARRKAYQRQEADRRAAEATALAELDRIIKEGLATEVRHFNQEYRETVYKPLACVDRVPQRSQFRSTKTAVISHLTMAVYPELAVAGPPPDWQDGNALKIGIHQSAINNTSRALAGQSHSLGSILRLLVSDDGPAADPKDEDVLITFSHVAPMRALFQHGHVEIELSGDAFQWSGQQFSGMNILLDYQLQGTGSKLELVVAQPPRVVHPAGPDGKRRRMGIRDLSLRRILLNVLKRELPVRFAPGEAIGYLAGTSFGTLRVDQLTSADGWLVAELQAVDSDQQKE